ncbi:acyl-CoA-like ligand-binding transcription factor [Paenibacillus aestuarii]|uniref:MftR C-terminal domain-containing protein n=1 Tax=Paenibacillus aestuarii TaxID=516965 RepID=A0ABW0KDS4_9BACL|nr:hypothetical protein [Paenibacillus aestuarii]
MRAASFVQMNDNIQMIAGLVAERLGRPQDNLEVQLFAGSMLGALMAVLKYCVEHPEADIYAVIDEALALYEAGLPIGKLGTVGK